MKRELVLKKLNHLSGNLKKLRPIFSHHSQSFLRLGGLLFFVFIALVVIFRFPQRWSQDLKVESVPQKPDWKPAKEILQRGDHPPVREILEINLHYDEKVTPALSLVSAFRKQGFSPEPESDEEAFSLTLLNQEKKEIYQTRFLISTTVEDPPPQSGEAVGKLPRFSVVDTTVTTPWFSEVDAFRVTDSQGKILLTNSLLEIPQLFNEPNFHSIRGGEQSQRLQPFWPPLLDLLEEAYAQNKGQYLDITFIGDNFLTASDLSQFHANVDLYSSHLLTYEPFRSRASQIYFHYVDNTSDLECRHDTNMARLIVCNESKVFQQVNNSGVPYDEVVVIVKDSQYGGSGGSIAVSYNGNYGSEVVVHELGHSFGRLKDEYVLYSGGTSDGKVYRNCYNGIPPAAEWEGIVSSSEYFLGCQYSNRYRSSRESIMRVLEARYFNSISQKLLNQEFDYYVSSPIPTVTVIVKPSPGPTTTPKPTASVSPTDTNPPQINISSPQDGTVLPKRGSVKIAATAFDPSGIARIEIAFDNQKIKTCNSTTSCGVKISLSKLSSGAHTITAKAVDKAPGANTSSVSITVYKQ